MATLAVVGNPRRTARERRAARLARAMLDATRKSRTGGRPTSRSKGQAAAQLWTTEEDPAVIARAIELVREVSPPRRAARPNPGRLAGAELLSTRVYEVAYRHAKDGRAYRHRFETDGVRLYCLADGSLLLRHPEHRLWAEFE